MTINEGLEITAYIPGLLQEEAIALAQHSLGLSLTSSLSS